MLSLRQRIFVIISIVLGLVLATVLAIVALQKSKTSPTPTSTPTGQDIDFGKILDELPAGTNTNTPPGFVSVEPEEVKQLTPTEMEQQYVRQLARLFVERFGSYSNQNRNQHIDEAKPLATEQMAEWVEKQRLSQERTYSGVTTRVIEHRLDSFQDGQATVAIGVQELHEGVDTSTVYRHGTVRLVKEGETWKVDGLFWER